MYSLAMYLFFIYSCLFCYIINIFSSNSLSPPLPSPLSPLSPLSPSLLSFHFSPPTSSHDIFKITIYINTITNNPLPFFYILVTPFLLLFLLLCYSFVILLLFFCYSFGIHWWEEEKEEEEGGLEGTRVIACESLACEVFWRWFL